MTARAIPTPPGDNPTGHLVYKNNRGQHQKHSEHVKGRAPTGGQHTAGAIRRRVSGPLYSTKYYEGKHLQAYMGGPYVVRYRVQQVPAAQESS